MADTTAIEWADATFNPWMGCEPIGPGCDHCYAKRWVERFGDDFRRRQRTSPPNWRRPLAWDAKHAEFFADHGRRRRVFCASLADVFDKKVPAEWRADLFNLIEQTLNLDWLLTTKRFGNVRRMVPPAWLQRGGWPTNVRLIITVVNQAEADRDIPKLLELGCPNGLSMEPLLGSVTLPKFCACGCCLPWERAVSDAMNGASALNRHQAEASVMTTLGIDWVIAGGESGPHARPMHPDWVRGLRDQCAAAGVPFLFKQWGEWTEVDTGLPAPLVAREGDPEFQRALAKHKGFISLAGHLVTDPDEMEDGVPYRGLVRPGKPAAGRLLDGRTHDGFPGSAR